MDLIVHAAPAGSHNGILQAGNQTLRCALGRSGIANRRREGSGATPVGVWPLRQVYYRPDRLARPICGLKVTALGPGMGWCDAPEDAAYNRPISLPFRARAEHLWRQDGVYDLIIVPGINDDPVIKGEGSALFIHVARRGYQPTEGCIALKQRDLLRMLPLLGPRSRLIVK